MTKYTPEELEKVVKTPLKEQQQRLTPQEFIERLRRKRIPFRWQLEVLKALDPDNTTHEEDPTMTKYADTLPEERAANGPTFPKARYVYHVHGHAKLHPSQGPAEHSGAEQQAVPFEVVLRRSFAIDSDSVMDSVRQDVRGHIAAELNKQGSPFIVGDVMIRGVSFLHRIMVDPDNPEGEAVRIRS